jgi:hypothetical protein
VVIPNFSEFAFTSFSIDEPISRFSDKLTAAGVLLVESYAENICHNDGRHVNVYIFFMPAAYLVLKPVKNLMIGLDALF